MRDRRGTEMRRPQGVRYALLLGCAGVALVSARSEAAGTLPSGGHFVAGTGGIAATGGTTTVTQSANRGIINWKSFSIGKGNTVQFNNGSGATLNRVTGGSLSTIAGQLKATGSVYLINQNGVVVAPGGKVVTGGSFVASTRDTSDSQFMAGGNHYFSGTSRGEVVNDGAVVSQTGSVVLIGHAVTNSGTIDAANGTAALASGNRVLMTEASGPDRVYVAGKSGDTTNDGQIRAAAVALASAGGNVYALAGNRTGLVRATGTKTVDGQVWLTAPDGTVDVGDRVVATDADGSGGSIQASGAALKLENKTVLNAAGTKGQGEIETSGGKVSIGKARVTAGQKGKWTIDPTDLTIDSGAASTISSTLNAGTDVTEQTTANTASGSGNQSAGLGDINVNAAITWSTTANLTLTAFHSINVNAPITVSGGGDLVLTTNNNVGGASSGDGTLSFVTGSGSTRFTGGSGAGASLTINGSAYTLIYDTGATATGLQSLNGSAGNFALAIPLDGLSLGTLTTSLIPTFGGTFNGLGNTLSNVTINDPAPVVGTGVFGVMTGGSITDFGVINARVSGSEGVSNLVGLVAGTVTLSRDYAAGTVTSGLNAGGLVGEVQGTLTITQSFASGTASAGRAGGLVGSVRLGSADISQSYATVTVGGANYGGVLGQLTGGTATLDQVYATGVVPGGGPAGLVFGPSGSVTVTNSYWDTQTTGQTASSGGGTGQTTAQLQAGLPSGFDSSVWGIVPGKSYPYLKWQFAAGTTPQVVAGKVYSDSGVTNAGSGITVSGAVNGAGFNSAGTGGTVTTGANGYYYYLLAPGTIAANGNVIVSAQNFGSGGTANGAALASQSDGYPTTLDIFANTLHVETPRTTWSLAQTDLATAEGGDASLTSLVNGLANLRVDATGSFGVNAAISYAGGTVTLNSGVAITESSSITASTLTGSSVGATTLNGTNSVGTLTSFSAGGALSFIDSVGLTTTGSILAGTGGTGDLSLRAPTLNLTGNGTSWAVSTPGAMTLTTTTGDMTLGAFESSIGTMTLNSAGQITENTATGKISAGTLTGSSVGGTNLASVNVPTLGAFANTGSGDLFIADTAAALSVTGAVSTASGTTLSIVNFGTLTLSATSSLSAPGAAGIVVLGKTGSGTITQVSGSVITAGTLEGLANGGVSLGGANQVMVLGSFDNGTSGNFSFTDARALATTGTVSSAGQLNLTTTGGAGSTLTLGGNVSTGNTVTLTATGAISQTGGIITAAVLTGGSTGSTNLNRANAISKLNGYAVTGGDFTLVDGGIAGTLTVAGPVSAGNVTISGAPTVSVTGSVAATTAASLSGVTVSLANGADVAGTTVTLNAGAGGIALTGTAQIGQAAGTVDISSAAAVTEASTSTITAGTLKSTGGISGSVSLAGTGNMVAGLGPLTALGGFALVDNRALTVNGTINGGTGDISLTTTAGGIAVNASLIASGHAVTLNSAGTITESGGGITATTLTGSSAGNTTLDGVNSIANLGAFSTTTGGANGDFTLVMNDANLGLNIVGAVNAGTGTVSLTNVSTGSPLVAAITEQAGGSIVAGTLTGSASGSAFFQQPGNLVTNLGAFTETHNANFSFINAKTLNVSGVVDAGTTGFIDIETTGPGSNLTIGNNLLAPGASVSLASAGTITQTAGIITASTLGGSSVGGATLTGANLVGTFGAFTNTGGGALSFTDAQALATSGTISSAGDLTLTTTGVGSTLTLNGDLTAAGNMVTLTATGAISQSAGIITAGTLTGLAVGNATLDGDNQVGTFKFANSVITGDISFTDTVAVTLSDSFSLNDITVTTKNGAGMTVIGTVHASHNLTLNSTGTITESGVGFVETGNRFSGSSVGGATLTGNNLVANFHGFTNTGSGDISFTNTAVNATVGGITTPGNLTLAAPGILIDGDLTAGSGNTVTLTSTGGISEGSGAIITAGTLTGSSTGATALDDANLIGTLASFTTGGDFAFTDARSFVTSGTIQSSNDLTLTASAGDDLTIGGAVTAGAVVHLNMNGKIRQSAGSVITASTLTGSAVGGAALNGANRVGDLGTFSNTGAGSFSFTDAQALTVIGAVQSSGSLTLTTTAGDLVLDADVTAPNRLVTLNSAGGIRQAGGAIDPGSLLINSVGSVSLTGANTIDTLAARVTGAGATLIFNDTANDLTIGTVVGVSGVTTNNGDITLRTSTFGDLTLARAVDAGTGTVTAAASGNLRIGGAGSVAAGAGATLATLGNFTNAAGAGAISVGAGSRWLVYSTDPAADRRGGLTPAFIQYAASYDVGTLTGTAAAAAGNGFLYSLAPTLTVTGVTKTYDGTTALSGAKYSFTGKIAGDTIVLGGSPAGGFAGKDAGTGIDVTLSGLTVTATRGGVAVYGYTVAPVTNDPIGTIKKATLTVSLAGSVVKTYDGTTTAILTGGNYDLTGLIAGDAVSLSAASSLYASKHAGTGITVTATGLTLTGADAGNYVLTKARATAAIGTIDPKTVTAGLTGTVTKVYDGTTAATLTRGNYTLTGIIAGDKVSLNDPTSGTYASAAAGTGIAVTVNGVALTGAAAGDYRLAATTLTAGIGTITPTVVTPPPPPPPPPPPHVVLPPTPFIPVQPPQPAQQAADPGAIAAAAHALVVPTPELADLARLSGCSGGDFVAVVPGEDGHVGAVVIEAEGNKTVLHAAYAGCSGSKPVITSPQEVNRLFGGALAARPTPPVNFEVYYNTGSARLEPDALAMLDKAFAEIARRKPVDVVVTGFTDTVGTPQGNDLLSLARAQQVTKLLLARGLMPGAVATFGRGQRDPQVPTPAQVAEEKNRRVEITVR